MADQETDFQVALLLQLAELAEVIRHHNVQIDASGLHKTALEHEGISKEYEAEMLERATAFEAKYGGQ
jgi:hypothetical protein